MENDKRKRVALMMGYYAYRLHKGVVDYAIKHNWILDASMAVSGKLPENWEGDGIISYHCGRDDIIGKINSSGVPAVDLGLPSEKISLPSVHHDNNAIGQMAAAHLIEQGFQNIGYVWYWYGDNDKGRSDGLRDKTLANGRNFQEFNWSSLTEELKEVNFPLGLMIQNDQLALELVNRLLEMGIKVPDEVAVIGADNDELYVVSSLIPITSVDDAVEDCGYRAAELLDHLMNGEEVSAEPFLVKPKKVVTRASTDCLSVPHLPTKRALQFIRENFHKPISIDQLADDSGMCRRRLEDAFKKYVGRTMANEIQRLRLEKAKKMLCETGLKINAIAKECGFNDGSHFSKVFKKSLSMTPNEFRLNELL